MDPLAFEREKGLGLMKGTGSEYLNLTIYSMLSSEKINRKKLFTSFKSEDIT